MRFKVLLTSQGDGGIVLLPIFQPESELENCSNLKIRDRTDHKFLRRPISNFR